MPQNILFQSRSVDILPWEACKIGLGVVIWKCFYRHCYVVYRCQELGIVGFFSWGDGDSQLAKVLAYSRRRDRVRAEKFLLVSVS